MIRDKRLRISIAATLVLVAMSFFVKSYKDANRTKQFMLEQDNPLYNKILK